MEVNWLAVLVAAFVPTAVGFLWYNPKTFGNTWMKAAGLTEDQLKGGNMALIFGLSFVFSLLLAMATNGLAIHQMNVDGIFMDASGNMPAPDSVDGKYLADFFAKYGDRHRTWSHGAVHGVFAGVFFALPILATGALFERKGWKYIAVNAGYWIVTLGIMGSILCAWV